MIVIAIIIGLLCLLVWLSGYYGIFFPVRWREPKKDVIRVACVGDSITYGFGVKNWYRNQYPKVLQRLLGKKYSVRNYGISGRTGCESGDSPYSKEKLYMLSRDYQPDIVVIMFGTNDTKVHNWKGPEQFCKEYAELLKSYIALSSKPKVYVMTPPCAYYPTSEQTEGPSSFDIQPAVVTEVRRCIIRLGEELNCPVIDLYPHTENQRMWFVKDGIHPNAAGANEIAGQVYSAIGKN